MRCPKTPSPAETLRPGSSRMCRRVLPGAAVRRGLWTVRGQDLGASSLVSPEVSEVPVSRRPATPQEAAPGRPAAPLAVRSPLAGSSTTATDPAEPVPGRRDRARLGTAGTDPADTPRRPSLAHRTARSTDAPAAPYGPAGACPAPATPIPARVSPHDPAAARSTDSGAAHHPAAAASLPKAPYREGHQPVGPGVEREPDGIPGAAVRQWDGRRRGRLSR